MKLSTIVAIASLALFTACGPGGSAAQTTPTPTTGNGTDTATDGQVKDQEVPPGMGKISGGPLGGMFGHRMAAGAMAPPSAGAAALFDRFIARMTQMANEMGAASGQCSSIAGALDSWRVDQVPFLLQNFADMDAYMSSLDAQQKDAMEARMESAGETIEMSMQMCSEDPAMVAAMERLMADLMPLADQFGDDDPCGGYDDGYDGDYGDPCGGYGDPCGGYGDPCGGYGRGNGDPCGDPCGP